MPNKPVNQELFNPLKILTLNNNLKMLLGVVVLAGAGYYLWKKSKEPKSFAN